MNCLPWTTLLGLLAGLLLPVAVSAAPVPKMPSPPFAGTVLPVPPQQKARWIPPGGLPGPLVSAATTLFDQGLADPRGGDYRQISVGIGNPWSGDSGVFQTHGWVLSADTPGGQRFAVCWNGLVYPVVSAGDRADLSADVNALIEADVKARAAWAKANPAEPYFRFLHGAASEYESVSETSLLPIKACLLVRLGEEDLARRFWDAWLAGTPPRHNNDDEALRDPYLTLADEWVWALFDRAVTAHMRGDDHLSLLSVRQLAALQPAVEAEAKRRGYPRQPDFGRHGAEQPYFPYLDPLPRLLADEERRVNDTLSRPTLADILAMSDKAARITALIRALDQVAARQMSQPGGVSPDADPIVQGLVAQGDDAVQPLIDTVGTDTRLTRSVGFGRDFFPARSLVSVAGAAHAALVDILHTSEFGPAGTAQDRAATTAALQAYWNRYKGLPVAERWYRTLANDKAAPAQWLDAAHEIVRPSDEQVRGGWIERSVHRGENVAPQGEALRREHTPSVSDLMARRVTTLLTASGAPGNDSRQFNDVENATTMALYLAAWNPQTARPVLRDQFERERKVLDSWRPHIDVTYNSLNLTKLTLARMHSGDSAALSEYVDWLQVASFNSFPEFSLLDVLEPLLRASHDPAARREVEYLFNDPHSPWVPLIQERPGYSSSLFDDLLEGPLLCLPPFRQAMLAALADRTVVRTVTLGGPDQQAGFTMTDADLDPFRPTVPLPFPVRRCDLYAWHLSHLGAMPVFEYDWPTAKKDAAVAVAAARLRRYGGLFASDLPPVFPGILPGEGGSPPLPTPILRFPRLSHPATAEDVAHNRAIFALGSGARVVPLPAFPLAAQWVTDRRYPCRVEVWSVARKKYEPGLGYSQDGNVWQAEATVGGRRFYGFVGPHDIARVPAEDIEFPPPRYIWTQVSNGLDCGVRDAVGNVLPYTLGLRAGQPLPLTLRLRSRQGLPQAVPATFLRSHLTLNLLFSPDSTGENPRPLTDPARTWEVVRPRSSQIPPAQARKLEPTEEFAAWTLDPHDSYDLSPPGTYRLQFIFDARPTESGAPSPEAAFRVTP